MPWELHIPVAVQVERRAPVSRWASGATVPIGVTPGRVALEDGALLVAGANPRHHAGHAAIVLHRRDTEGLLANLQSREPVLYVVMRPGEGGMRLHLVTASDHEAQDHTDAGEDEVARVPMPPAIREAVEAFVAAHHSDEPRYKRKRRPASEAHVFGQEPVWALPEGTLTDDRLDRPQRGAGGKADRPIGARDDTRDRGAGNHDGSGARDGTERAEKTG